MGNSTKRPEIRHSANGQRQHWHRVVVAGFVVLLCFGGYMLFHGIDPHDLQLSLKKVDLPLAASLIALNILAIILVGWRTGVLVSAIAPDVSYLGIAYINVLSMVSSYANVGKMNAPIKAVLLKKMHGVPISRVAPVLVAEAAFDLAALILVTAIGLALAGPFAITLLMQLGWRTGSVIEHIVIAASLTGIFAGTFWLLRKRVKFIASVAGAIRQLGSDRGRLFRAAWLTAVIHIINILAVASALYFLGLSMDFVILMTALPIVAGLFTPLPGGLGVREFIFGAVYGLCCGSATLAVIAALLLRMAFFASLPLVFAGVKLTETLMAANVKSN